MTAIPLNDLQPRLSPQVTDLFATLPVGAQVLENTTLGAIANAIGTLGVIPRTLVYVIDGGGSPIATGVHGALYLPFPVTIQPSLGASLLADQSGSCVIDIGAMQFSAYTGAFSGSITASAQPTLSSAVKYLDNTLTGWTTVFTAGVCLVFKVVSLSTITRLTITLGVIG